MLQERLELSVWSQSLEMVQLSMRQSGAKRSIKPPIVQVRTGCSIVTEPDGANYLVSHA